MYPCSETAQDLPGLDERMNWRDGNTPLVHLCECEEAFSLCKSEQFWFDRHAQVSGDDMI